MASEHPLRGTRAACPHTPFSFKRIPAGLSQSANRGNADISPSKVTLVLHRTLTTSSDVQQPLSTTIGHCGCESTRDRCLSFCSFRFKDHLLYALRSTLYDQTSVLPTSSRRLEVLHLQRISTLAVFLAHSALKTSSQQISTVRTYFLST